ncbi:MAG: FdhF/YdeP family oxidoreductase, partial [Herpetosiphonaceae bacterium]|nr:FdhF/YdeP family oxidoreductase [Herpetosiphonaceae bacterium]
MKQPKKRWMPSLWASRKPFGLGEQRPNNYLELWKALRDNADQLPYAWRILNQGVCDGCALGTTGLKDWTLDGVHLCNIRLRLLRLNTMPAFDPAILADVAPLRAQKSSQLRELGRLPYPLIRQRGEAGFRRISWDAALDLVAERIQASAPDRLGFYLTSRGMPNESYYAAQKAVRAIGTNSIDNAARICHSPSTVALKSSLGIAATTCSYPDWIGSDLIVFIGSNVANNQPVTTKYLYYAKKAGTQVAVINTFREPGMERYWVPSVPESALFGTKIADRFFLINQGGDVAFINGTLKHMIANGWLDLAFVQAHTSGFQELAAALGQQAWEELEAQAGASRAEMLAFAEMVGAAKTAVFVWSMGITQHEFGESNVASIVNLALTKGFVGRDGCGVMPIRGHSGVQGGAEMGAYATAFPGGAPVNPANAALLSAEWGFEVPAAPGLTAPEMIDRAGTGELDVLFSAGGNFLEVLPDPDLVEAALGRIPLRVHMDIILSSQMLVEPAETVLLLPAMTRYEVPGGVTETSTERRIIFSPEIPGPRIGEARAEWDVLLDLARRVRPELAAILGCASTPAIRAEIAEVVPMYAGIENLKAAGDQVQYGGRHLCADWVFPTPDGKAHFTPVPLARRSVPEGMFQLATRRGKQFNSMVHEQVDAITGAAREAVLISRADAERLGLGAGDAVVLRNDQGSLAGRVVIAPIQPGNL